MRFRRERGFALLIVLWAVVFLSFLMTQIMGAGRQAISLSGNLRAAARARAADDGAVDAAVFHLLAAGPAHWNADSDHMLEIGGATVAVSTRRLAGMVNPNLASAALLSGLLQAVGVSAAESQGLAAAIIAWRAAPANAAAGAALRTLYHRAGAVYAPPGRPFADLGELSYVIGMTPGILRRLAPHLSLFQPGDPERNLADPTVREALALAGPPRTNAGERGALVVTISACATPPTPMCRRGVVSLAGVAASTPYLFLALDDE